MLAHSRTFTAVAVLSLALGIGANTAIFTLVNSLLLRTLPVHEPEGLVQLDGDSTTNPIWEQIQSRQRQLFCRRDRLVGPAVRPLPAADRRSPSKGCWVSGEFFEVLGVPPILGRTFTTGERPSRRRRRGRRSPSSATPSGSGSSAAPPTSSAVRSRSIGVAFTIIGVTPPEFLGPQIGRGFDVAVPLRTVDILDNAAASSGSDGRSMWWLNITARLKPGQSPDQATAALRAVQPQIREATTPDRLARSI